MFQIAHCCGGWIIVVVIEARMLRLISLSVVYMLALAALTVAYAGIPA
jgi:hypothetical protein